MPGKPYRIPLLLKGHALTFPTNPFCTMPRSFARNKPERSEMSWILVDNQLMRKGLEVLGAKIYKTYRIYRIPL
jgi:hypothetical protein